MGLIRKWKAWREKRQERYARYLCDPQKHSDCSYKNSGCWYTCRGPCKCTTKKCYAQRDANGKPVIAADRDLYNEEYLELMLAKEQEEHMVPRDPYKERR